MATTKELEQRIDDLTKLLAERGVVLPPRRAEDDAGRADYIEFGSERHMGLLGLVPVEDAEKAREVGFHVFASPETGKAYRLEDQVTAFMHFPDPAQVAKLVLMQKVSELEAGRPPVPANAPSLWRPDEF